MAAPPRKANGPPVEDRNHRMSPRSCCMFARVTSSVEHPRLSCGAAAPILPQPLRRQLQALVELSRYAAASSFSLSEVIGAPGPFHELGLETGSFARAPFAPSLERTNEQQHRSVVFGS